MAVRKRDGYNLLETRHDVKKKVMSNDMLEESRLFSKGTKRFPISKKGSTHSESTATSTVANPKLGNLRQKDSLLGVGKAAAEPKLTRSNGGRHENLSQEPKLTSSRVMKNEEWVKKLGIVDGVPVIRFLRTL